MGAQAWECEARLSILVPGDGPLKVSTLLFCLAVLWSVLRSALILYGNNMFVLALCCERLCFCGV